MKHSKNFFLCAGITAGIVLLTGPTSQHQLGLVVQMLAKHSTDKMSLEALLFSTWLVILTFLTLALWHIFRPMAFSSVMAAVGIGVLSPVLIAKGSSWAYSWLSSAMLG